jgi:formate dehydrogenase
VITDPRIREDLDGIARRGEIVVFDPRRTETARTYSHQPIRPDGDVFLLSAMLAVLGAEGLLDRAFATRWATGVDELLQAAGAIPLALAEERSGISEARIKDLARRFAATPRAAAYSRVGVCRGAFPTLTNILFDLLNILTGKMGAPGGAVFGFSPIAFDAGADPDVRAIGQTRTRVGGLPSVGGHLPSTMLPGDILEEGPGRVRALLVNAANPVMSVPGSDRMEQALEDLELMVSLDIYETETSRHAHYILPTTTFLEREDMQLPFMAHMVRPFLQYTAPVVPPRGEARTEPDILNEISRRMGLGEITVLPHLENTPPQKRLYELYDGILRAGLLGDQHGAKPEGLSLEKLAKAPHGLLIEGRYPESNWSTRLKHADGKIHCWSAEVESEFARLAEASEQPLPDLVLFSRRELRSINSWMHNVERLTRKVDTAVLVHPRDAAVRGLEDNSTARLATAAGAIEVQVRISTEVLPGTVCYPHGWGHRGGWLRANGLGGANFNLLASAEPADQEQLSGMSRLEGIPVQLHALSPQTLTGETDIQSAR